MIKNNIKDVRKLKKDTEISQNEVNLEGYNNDISKYRQSIDILKLTNESLNTQISKYRQDNDILKLTNESLSTQILK